MPFSNTQLMFRNNRVECNSILLQGKHFHGIGTEVSWFFQTLAGSTSEAYNQDEGRGNFAAALELHRPPAISQEP